MKKSCFFFSTSENFLTQKYMVLFSHMYKLSEKKIWKPSDNFQENFPGKKLFFFTHEEHFFSRLNT